MSEVPSLVDHDTPEASAKGTWAAPTVEELDLNSTELNNGQGVDGGLYQS